MLKSKNQSTLEEISNSQIEAINKIMCDYEVDIRYRGIEYGGTEVYFIIKPGIITEAATISFNNVVAYAQARFFEYFQTESNRNERAVGTYKTYLPTIELAKIKNNTQMVKRDKNGIVDQIIYKHYYDVDIDLVEGTVDLQLNSGTLQGVDPKIISIKAPYDETN